VDAILAGSQQTPRSQRPPRRPEVPEGRDEVYDPGLRAKETAWAELIEELKASPDVRRYAGQGAKAGPIEAVTRVVMRRGDPVLREHAREAAIQALADEAPVHPSVMQRDRSGPPTPLERILEAEEGPLAQAARNTPGVRYAARHLDPERVRLSGDPRPTGEKYAPTPLEKSVRRQIDLLERRLDEAYRRNAPQERIDRMEADLARLIDREEGAEVLESDGVGRSSPMEGDLGEGPSISMEQNLAKIYADYAKDTANLKSGYDTPHLRTHARNAALDQAREDGVGGFRIIDVRSGLAA
jgi:hypothetical protein